MFASDSLYNVTKHRILDVVSGQIRGGGGGGGGGLHMAVTWLESLPF